MPVGAQHTWAGNRRYSDSSHRRSSAMDPRFQINWLAAQFAQRLNAALQLLNDSYLLEKPEIEEALFQIVILGALSCGST